MYANSEAVFEVGDIIRIKFPVRFLKECIKENVKKEFSIDISKIILVSGRSKYSSLAYNVEDPEIGIILNQICIVSDKLGFIVSPIIKLHEFKVLRCYEMMKLGKCNYSFNLNNFENDVVELVLNYSL